jgi:hypothetical protein
MVQIWRYELRSWANRFAESLVKQDGVIGVIIGGSLARGQEWRHSDLEIGILVEERNQVLPYFNISEGRGVEIIQLVRPDLEAQLELAESGDLNQILNWPIQLWEGRVVYDPSGVLARFKKQFDAGLFIKEVVEKRLAGLNQKITKTLEDARGLLAAAKPAAALVITRGAMNEAILAIHWAHGELPRSQNRTDSRLRRLCSKHQTMPFYALYRDVFDLSDTQKIIKKTWPVVRESVLEITRLWGDPARDFFVHAVDSHFAWRQNAGILTVYRLYVPIIGRPEQGIFNLLDNAEWAGKNKDLMRFLGLTNANQDVVTILVDRLEYASKDFWPSPDD